MKNTQQLILASSSPRRKELMQQLGLVFTTAPSNYKEDMTLNLSPEDLVKELSRGKAEDIAKKFGSGIIIGCDTVVENDGKILGKPTSKAKAKEILRAQSGKTQRVHSGLTLIDIDNKKTLQKSVVSVLTMKELSEKEIDNYVSCGEAIEKAGAFAIQGRGAAFIKEVHGSYSNIVGMPLYELMEALKELGYLVF